MRLKVEIPETIQKTKTIPDVVKWDISIEIFHSEKTMRFLVKYITSDINNRERVVESAEYRILDNEYTQFWQFADPQFVNLGRSLKKRVIQTFKFKGWLPAAAEDVEGEV